MYKFRNRIGIDGYSSILSSLPARIFFCKGIAVITKRQIPCRKSSSNKLSVFSALNLPYWAASTLIKAKNIPSDKLKNSKTEGKKSERMAQIDNNLKKQLAKPQTWFCKYFPKRIRNVGEKEIADRQMVYDFKDGRSFEAVAQMTAANMQEQYGESCRNIVFVQVPASTSPKNELRYKAFCERVCELTGAINGYEHVRVIGVRLAIHENRKIEKEIRKVHIIDFDEDWFSGKSVVTFDDVITRGITWATYADQLENLGAHVIGGIFLAKTTDNETKIYDKGGFHSLYRASEYCTRTER